jgi:hypothetical protein
LKIEFVQKSPNPNKIATCHPFKREIPVTERSDNLHARKESNVRGESIELGSWFPKPYFSSKKKRGGDRPVINLRELNGHMLYRHFKMESIYQVKDYFTKGL